MAASKMREGGRSAEEGLRLLHEHVGKSPNDARAWFKLAGAYDSQGREGDAIGFYRHAMRLGVEGLPEEERPRLYVQMGSTLRNILHFDEAIACLQQGVERFPENRALQVFLALAQHSAGNTGVALRSLFAAILDYTDNDSINDYRRALVWYVENLETYPAAPSIAIRKATLADRVEIAKVHVAAIRGNAFSHYTAEQVDAWSAGKSPEDYPVDTQNMYVAVINEEIVGFGELHLSDHEVRAIYVSPNAARVGVGTRLLETIEGAARGAGLIKLTLGASLNAVAFYLKHGFHEIRRDFRSLADGTKLPYVLMEKSLLKRA